MYEYLTQAEKYQQKSNKYQRRISDKFSILEIISFSYFKITSVNTESS